MKDELSERTKLRERFAVALAGNSNFRSAAVAAIAAVCKKDVDGEVVQRRATDLTFTIAQYHVDEAMKRRDRASVERAAAKLAAGDDNPVKRAAKWGNG